MDKFLVTPRYKNATIIIPAYNEENRISQVLDDVSDFVNKNNLNWNVIVSIDGNDNTDMIAKKYSDRYNFIKYYKKEGRNGKGNSIKRVLDYVDTEFVILMDADNSIQFAELIKNFYLMDKYDVIVFNRYLNRENYIPLLRRIASREFNILVRAFLGIKIKDTQSGYKIIKADLLKEVFKKITITNAFFDVPILFYSKKINARMLEINARYKHDGNSKFNVISLTMGEAVSLIAFTIRQSKFYKYVPDSIKDLYYRKFRWI